MAIKMPPHDTGSWGPNPEHYQLDHYNHGVKYAKRRRVAVDCGAHVGIFTRRFAQDFAEVIAIEPVNYDLLRENTQEYNNVTIHPCAVSNTQGKLFLTTPDSSNSGWWELTDNVTELEVEVITIDSLNLEVCDYVKVDTQKKEQEVLEGASETINRCKPTLHVETKDKALLRWIEQTYNYSYAGKHIKDHILIPKK